MRRLILLAPAFLIACSSPKPAATLASGPSIIGGTAVARSSDLGRVTGALMGDDRGWLCTFTLVSEEWLVTAGHCVLGSSAESLEAVFETEVNGHVSERNVIKIKEVHVHPAYVEIDARLAAEEERLLREEKREITAAEQDAYMDWGDIALLKLARPALSRSKFARLIPADHVINKGERLLLAGYGETNGVEKSGSGQLREAMVEVAEPRYGKTEILFDQRDGFGCCHGDSGGPAFVVIDGIHYLTGVTSRGIKDENDDCTTFAAYTDVRTYRDWIKEISGL